MSITRIHEDPRVTLPYTDDQWQRIEALGYQIDRDISAGDIRLTMGGEPTFVSIDDMEGAEWNIAALGTEKRKLSEQLLWRLYERFAPGGLLHYGQGKWYPGEPLPRWALTLLLAQGRRADVARRAAARARRRRHATSGRPRRSASAETLARRLGVDPGIRQRRRSRIRSTISQRERQSADQRRSDRQSAGRSRASANASGASSSAGLETPTGYVLPLQRGIGKDGPQWQTGLWMLRGQHLFLIPGDSALGLRLPLPSLPWVAAVGSAADFSRSIRPARSPPLPEPQHVVARRAEAPGAPRSATCATSKPGARRIGAMDRSHRAVRRAARRPPARLHAAAGSDRGLHRIARRDRGHRRASGNAGGDRGLHAARRLSHQQTFR